MNSEVQDDPQVKGCWKRTLKDPTTTSAGAAGHGAGKKSTGDPRPNKLPYAA